MRNRKNVTDEYRDGDCMSLPHIAGDGFCFEFLCPLPGLPDSEDKPAIPWTVQFLLDDITTFNIGFPIPYKLQKAQAGLL